MNTLKKLLIIGSLLGYWNAQASTRETIYEMLKAPPSIVEAIYKLEDKGKKGDVFQRCAWSTNGFFVIYANSLGDLERFTNLKPAYGRAGNIVWSTGSGVLSMSDVSTETPESIKDHFGDIRIREIGAFFPLQMGVLQLRPDHPVIVSDNGFETKDLKNRKLSGTVKPSEEGFTIDYRIEGVDEFKWVAHLTLPTAEIPLPQWSYTESIELKNGYERQFGMMGKDYRLLSCILTNAALPAEHFHPSRLLTNSHVPLVIGLIQSNNLLTVTGNRIVASEPIKKRGLNPVWPGITFGLMVSGLAGITWKLTKGARR